MIITTNEWGTRIYPFAEHELQGWEGYLSINKYAEPGRVAFNLQLGDVTREQWEKLHAAMQKAFELASPPPHA